MAIFEFYFCQIIQQVINEDKEFFKLAKFSIWMYIMLQSSEYEYFVFFYERILR